VSQEIALLIPINILCIVINLLSVQPWNGHISWRLLSLPTGQKPTPAAAGAARADLFRGSLAPGHEKRRRIAPAP
jgi:hypothetical protein